MKTIYNMFQRKISLEADSNVTKFYAYGHYLKNIPWKQTKFLDMILAKDADKLIFEIDWYIIYASKSSLCLLSFFSYFFFRPLWSIALKKKSKQQIRDSKVSRYDSIWAGEGGIKFASWNNWIPRNPVCMQVPDLCRRRAPSLLGARCLILWSCVVQCWTAAHLWEKRTRSRRGLYSSSSAVRLLKKEKKLVSHWKIMTSLHMPRPP